MNQLFTLRSLPLALTVLFGACTLTQPPAPVVSGNGAGYGNNYGGNTAAADSNPYGAQPYTPPGNTQTAADTPYSPPAAAPYNPPANTTAPAGSYTPSYAPVDVNAAQHTVVRGDTVYNIALRYRISQDNLRAWNNLADNNISVGQVLRVKPAGYTAPTAAQTQQPATPPRTAPTPTPPANTASTPASTPSVSGATRSASGITWQRPTAGSILTRFGGNEKGINFGGNAGQPVVAAADGKVVYSGSGLRGYGNLIIVQHNQTYLTAYGHNQRLLVREGQTVRRGQSIATMGNSDSSRVQLHFELRKNGQPVDPLQYIPN
ncbi:peptidoglycan DD-metalloendopeptidase family protein [Eikenella sp. S3360]|uniref:Peptidoglycan DD-metalloendopeptidase family protein n=1 Tax=Eikenella glucosivorans TaxID=2766967 RepID=A0ABS0N7B7_9NEIS|nr:peptidoglycan DD-metalloendopeptidase family protein [Eikenella glucosivorans]MBH5328164.1 peptidoglycan DD-metalloendopeptidase family protein [Eikenella glucosivorans]